MPAREGQNDRLHHLLRQLQRAQFGRRSEQLDREQMQLALEDIETSIAEQDAQEDKKDTAETRADTQRKKRRANRGSLPASSRIHVTLAPEMRLSVLSWHDARHRGGYRRASRRDPRPIPGDRDASSPIRLPGLRTGRGPGPSARTADQRRAADRGDSGRCPGCQIRLAFSALSPIPDAASQGIAIERATLAFWVGYAAAELKPLYLRLRELILGSAKIAVDETVAPVLDPGRGRTKKGYFWAIARDDRPWGGTDPPAVAYTYAPGRGAVHGLKLLESYRGIVQCDGYAAYKTIADDARIGDAITLAFCWAHLRRQFFDIAKGGSAPIATEALERIAALYAIEKTIRGKSADERHAVRQDNSKPLVLALKTWLELQLARSRRSPSLPTSSATA